MDTEITLKVLNDLASHYPEAKVYIGEEEKEFLS